MDDGQVGHVRLANVCQQILCLYVCVVRMFDRRRQRSRAIEGRRLWLVTETREGLTRSEIRARFHVRIVEGFAMRRKWQLHVKFAMRGEQLLDLSPTID